MALTKVSGGILDPGINVAGIVTATGFDGPFIGGSDGINAGVGTFTGLDVNGNGDISGNLVVGGNLTANGDFTTLNTTLREVEILHVDANTTAVAGIITQRGSGDIFSAYDTSTEVFKIADGGDITFFGGSNSKNASWDYSTNTLSFDGNGSVNNQYAKTQFGSTSQGMKLYNNLNNFISVPPIVALFVESADFQIYGSGSRGGTTYDGTIFIAREGVVELGHEVGGGGATGMKLKTVGYGVTVLGTTETQKLNVTGISTFEGNIDANGDLDVDGHTDLDNVSIAGVTTMSGNLQITDATLSVTSAAPEIFLTDTNANSDYSIVVNGGQFRVRDETNSANRLAVNSDGHVDIYGRLDAVGGFVASSNSSIEGNLELTSTYPSLTWTDTNHNSDFRITNNDGTLIVYDITRGAHVLDFKPTGDLHLRNDKGIYFGESNDLLIGHDGSSTRIEDSYGYLNIKSNALDLRSYTGSELYANFTVNGSAKLYYDSTERFTTTGIGVSVIGEVEASQDYPNFRPTLDFNFAAQKKLDPRIAYTRTGPASFVNEFGKVVKVGDNVPRFDHNPITRESKGLLLEESRTNVAESSEDFDNTTHWEKYSVTVTTNVATSPDGTLTADNIIPASGSAAARYLYFSNNEFPLATNTSYTTSIFVKKNGLRYFAFQAHDNGSGSGHRAGFDLDNGTVVSPNNMGSASGVSASIVEFPNGWFRCILSGTTAGSGSIGRTAFCFSSALNAQASVGAITADGTNGGYVWGHQVEAGAFATSYIPTDGAAVNRGVDLCQITGEDFSDFYNQDEGTIVSEHSIATGVASGDNTYVYQVDDGNDLNVAFRLIDHNSAHGDVLRAYGFLSNNWNSPIYGSQTSTPDHDSFLKVAVGIKKDDFGINFFGGTTYTDNSGDINVDMTQITLGNHRGGTAPLQGYLRRFIYYPQKLTTNQLKTITS